MNKNFSVYLIVVAVTVLIIGLFIWKANLQKPDSRIEPFAKCLAKKKVTMYGAYWCGHCQNQKKLFGSAFKEIPYVECTEWPQRCIDEGVKGYPTWIFPDGERLEGEQSLETLANKAGCDLSLGISK